MLRKGRAAMREGEPGEALKSQKLKLGRRGAIGKRQQQMLREGRAAMEKGSKKKLKISVCQQRKHATMSRSCRKAGLQRRLQKPKISARQHEKLSRMSSHREAAAADAAGRPGCSGEAGCRTKLRKAET